VSYDRLQSRNANEEGSLMTTKTTIPMMSTARALQSMRHAGYDFAAALGEPIDNSLEAGANTVRVRLESEKNKRGKEHVHRIAIADDGEGMNEDVLHHYLQIGFSTRFMSTNTMGKFGVGAKLAALNYARRIDVWSRVDPHVPWRHVQFDLDKAIEDDGNDSEVGIEPPDEAPVPEALTDMLPAGTGTLVLWSKVDQLEEGRRAPTANDLRLEVEKELARVYRYFLDGGRTIRVNDTQLVAHDPLFLMNGTWAENLLRKHYNDERLEGPDFEANKICDEPVEIKGVGAARVRITLYPKKVVRKRGMGGDDLAKSLRVPENQGQISFVRHNREISYTNVPRIFPRGVDDPDRFIGIEVSFEPTLDEYLGVRNVKRGVEPHGQLRDLIRKTLKKYLPEARKRLEDIWGEYRREDKSKGAREHEATERQAKDADRTMPRSQAKGPSTAEEEEQILNDLAEDVIGAGEERASEREEYKANIRGLPFVVESVSFPGRHFIEVQHLSGMIIFRINTRHRFYREVWEPLKEVAEQDGGVVSAEVAASTARRAVEALTQLVIAYGKAEAMHPTPHEQYGTLRDYWGMFLDHLLGSVKHGG